MSLSWPTEVPTTPWEMTVAPQPPETLEPSPVPQATMPATVWVAVVTVVTEILVRTPTVNTTAGKSMGMGGLFGHLKPGGTAQQEHTAARVCGVAATEDEARQLLGLWKIRNPQSALGDEMVVQVKFGVEADIGLEAAETRQCEDCDTVITMGNRCRACADKWGEKLRAKDAEILVDALKEAEATRSRSEKRDAYNAWKENVGR